MTTRNPEIGKGAESLGSQQARALHLTEQVQRTQAELAELDNTELIKEEETALQRLLDLSNQAGCAVIDTWVEEIGEGILEQRHPKLVGMIRQGREQRLARETARGWTESTPFDDELSNAAMALADIQVKFNDRRILERYSA